MSLISQNARPKNEVNKSKREVEDDAENIDSLKMKKRKKRDGEGEQLAMEQVKEMKKLENFLFGSLYTPLEFGKEDHEVEPGNAAEKEEDADLSEESHGHDDGCALERKPVWVDDEEENATVNIAKVNRLRKLRKGEDENLISGSNRCSDDETTDEENEAVVSCGYEDVDDVLRTNEDLIVKSGAKLLPGHLEYSRLVDANIQDPSNGPINSVQFHRNAQLLLAAGLDRKLRLFQIDGKRNTKIQSIFLEDCPIRKASFLPDGSQVILSGRRKFFYSFDLVKARVDRIGPLVGREERVWRFLRCLLILK
ncbi:U3 small nucleolar RNA-associated protein 18-like [Spatholobus suberectus]|nr:U3 small nucleolar RNA-associated protein 18-like [Spatholobus suberectus]